MHCLSIKIGFSSEREIKVIEVLLVTDSAS